MKQMIIRLKEIHECGFLHKDIKPDNFCLGGPHFRDIYLIDFGLSKKYIDEDFNQITKPGHGFVGTPRYASRNSHYRKYFSRIDDLEGLGYVCLYLVLGELPW